MQTIKLIVFSLMTVLLISACGGGGSSSGSSNTQNGSNDDPYVDPNPTVDSFPSQVAKPTIMVVNDNGSLVLAASGLSLYTFDNDSANSSSCEGSAGDTQTCAGIWPPLLASSGAVADDTFTMISRGDGENQWAMNGQALYTYYLDSAQGDTAGDGINNIWHLARPMPLATTQIGGQTTYIGKYTILSVSDSSGVLTKMRVNKDQFTLYTFDSDPIGASVCTGACINAWPPLLADAGAVALAPLSLIDVGTNKQWTLNGKPLYFYVGDSGSGDTNGEYSLWTIARP